jgi:hypothetical protein
MIDAKYRADFDHVTGYLDAFFDRSSVQSALARITEQEVTGWERWWQIELGTWLGEQHLIGACVMEEPFEVDGRHGSDKSKMLVDIGFRLKNHSTQEWIFLELKQNRAWRTCINNMLSDVEKVHTAKKRSTANSLTIRSFFAVGIHPFEETSKAAIKDYINDECDERELNVPRELIWCKKIKGVDRCVTVF